jgi:hypothetical protein
VLGGKLLEKREILDVVGESRVVTAYENSRSAQAMRETMKDGKRTGTSESQIRVLRKHLSKRFDSECNVLLTLEAIDGEEGREITEWWED